MKISVHCLVKNEDRFVWYPIMSVIDYVDVIRIWDTGSTDNTLEIIEKIRKRYTGVNKIIVKKFNLPDFREGAVRQQMLDSEKADWFIVLDADEIWWDDSIKKVTDTIRKDGDKLESIVVPTYNVVGDIFHYQERQAGRYHLAGRVGHYNLRAINRKIPGLHAFGEHGVFSWRDENDVKIESRDKSKIKFIDAPYIHATHLKRSGSRLMDKQVFKRKMKLKHELGIKFPGDFYYPEVFFRPRPAIVPSIWDTLGAGYKLNAFIQTPPKKIRRRYFMKGVKHGY